MTAGARPSLAVLGTQDQIGPAHPALAEMYLQGVSTRKGLPCCSSMSLRVTPLT
jgi:hypothetical protein